MDFLCISGHSKELKVDISIVSTSSEQWEATNLLHSISGAVPQFFFKNLLLLFKMGLRWVSLTCFPRNYHISLVSPLTYIVVQ